MTPALTQIFTDGGCRGNPGIGGWGALLRYRGHDKELWGAEPHTTNNRMELTAVIRALEALKRPTRAEIYTDSKYVQQGITAWMPRWKANGWKTADRKPVKNAELWQRLDALAQGHRLSWVWVKGHAGHPGNERADELANRAMDALAAQASSS